MVDREKPFHIVPKSTETEDNIVDLDSNRQISMPIFPGEEPVALGNVEEFRSRLISALVKSGPPLTVVNNSQSDNPQEPQQ